ncbi:MAG: hypothetical protein R2912_12775 [Eubacteriales bacterium]
MQSTGCSPFVDADLLDGVLQTHAGEHDCGQHRRRRTAQPRQGAACRAVKNSGGAWIAVSDENILDAMQLAPAEPKASSANPLA